MSVFVRITSFLDREHAEHKSRLQQSFGHEKFFVESGRERN